jgi:hypothetical protein
VVAVERDRFGLIEQAQADGRTEAVVTLLTDVIRSEADPEAALAFLRDGGMHPAAALGTNPILSETVEMTHPLVERE